MCDGKNENVTNSESSWVIKSMDKRLRYRDSLVDITNYAKQKNALENKLYNFLRNFSTERDIVTANPEDIRQFLVFKDRKGKTCNHTVDYTDLGEKVADRSSCPHRLSEGTIQSLFGNLIFFKTMAEETQGT